MSRVGRFPSTRTAYDTAYHRLVRAGFEPLPLERECRCGFCGRQWMHTTARGPLPELCLRCTIQVEKEQNRQRTFMRSIGAK